MIAGVLIGLYIEPAEQAACVPLENRGPLARAHLDAFDDWLQIVERPPRLRIDSASAARALGAEATSIRSNDLEQELQRLLVVQHGIEPETPQCLIEALRVFGQPARLDGHLPIRAPAAHLVGNRATAVADEELERGEVPENLRT